MDLKYKRKLNESVGDKATQICIPRPIVQAWHEYAAVDLVFDGERVIIMPDKTSKKVTLE